MARKYTKSKRAEQEAETRRRITEAALDLHREVGPARTTLSQIAERADVQRHTLYAHFPDEKSLFLACSALHFERDPPPEGAGWSGLSGRGERLRTGLGAIYGWFGRNEDLLAAVMRDAELNPALREVSQARLSPYLDGWRKVLGAADDPPAARAMLELAFSFHTWRTLAREAGAPDPAGLMTSSVLSAGR